MSEEKTLFERLYEAGEENLTRLAKEILAHPTFAAAMEKAFRNAAATKGKIDRNMSTLLGIFNIPSKGDYTALLAKVEAIQGSLVNAHLKLDRILASQEQRAKSPSRKGGPRRSSTRPEGKPQSG
ncbi:MAG: hypothetical protein NZ578_04795 [Candidatus Binatia bacterium]|nr:hypothetical protein [Candidatus Binatia bacterium]